MAAYDYNSVVLYFTSTGERAVGWNDSPGTYTSSALDDGFFNVGEVLNGDNIYSGYFNADGHLFFVIEDAVNVFILSPTATGDSPGYPDNLNDLPALITDPLPICFAAGSLIATPQGELQVEDLRVGTGVLTRDHGIKEIRWIGVQKLGAAALATNPNLRPIRVRAGALGKDTPTMDLLVSPQHRILLRSRIAQRMCGATEVLVAAKQLLQLEGVDIAHDMQEVEYYHFLLDHHEIVFANGAETESLYTGVQALKSVGPAAREEIFAIFPELRSGDQIPEPACVFASGRQARKLIARHIQNDKPAVVGQVQNL